MSSTFRNIFAIAIFTIFFSNLAKAQPRKGEFIKASVGLGLTAPYDEEDITGSGFYAQGEYVFGITKWFGLRPYAGFVLTSADKNTDPQNQPEYKVTSKAFLLGGKARILAPIPWVAPYFEVGVGASIGSFETYTPYTNIKKNGIVTHIPFTVGLALGPKHNLDLAFTYYYQPSVQQFSGATAIGFSFPLN
ncbi:MAG: hypothetical protein H7Y10_15950 [Flavobacterium sp.]|nr:hypothetical protein [Flavobacterium sp.]